MLDFYCDAVRLAIEVDGEAHERGHQPSRDVMRDAWLADQGVTTLRIPARAILCDLDAFIRHITDAARTAPSTSSAGPPPPAGEE